ncbi:hypothetical protein BJ508DRAFT_212747 [Ascobolus immersus RN42]|uniref:B30.2/SPRY domain-containing protein n=1 Tax=Ascobolus immersus RN42 TaxID=1160509 RepID=A0A3N4HYC7_ASCIM|nr:hypothetical protein BJ508DRAFT_212747 [Ascobolus immersus RN42]
MSSTSHQHQQPSLGSGLSNATKGILIGLASALGSAALVAVLFGIIYFFRCTRAGRIILDGLGRGGEWDDEQEFARVEEEGMRGWGEVERGEYLRAKAFLAANPPSSLPTEITLSQYLAIQEKGVSAWEFVPELELANNCFVQGRTEIEFFEGEGATSVQTNLPLPKQNDTVYWEAKIFELGEGVEVGVGVGVRPWPGWRLPGLHKHSLAYHSPGRLHRSSPFTPHPFPPFHQGDVIGLAYRPRTGSLFFTRNGKRLDLPPDYNSSSILHTWKHHNLFPTIGATGPAKVHVNLGQSGFVFIEANVKRWGLAPVGGTLGAPPAYGEAGGDVLPRAGTTTSISSTRSRANTLRDNSQRPRGTSFLNATRPPAYGGGQPLSPGPARSPTDISLAPLNSDGSSGDNRRSQEMRRSQEGRRSMETRRDGQAQTQGQAQGQAQGEGDLNQQFGGPPPEYESGSESDRDETRPLVNSNSAANGRGRD